MQAYRFTEGASLGRIGLAVLLTVGVSAALSYGYSTLVRDCPLLDVQLWFVAVLFYGGLLGKSLEKIVRWTGLRGVKVANLLAILGLGIGTSMVYGLCFRGPVEKVQCIQHLMATTLTVCFCFYNFRWQQYGFCDACKRWLKPVAQLGPYRYDKGLLARLEMQHCLDLSFLEDPGSGTRKYCEMVLSSCPGCRGCSTLRVVKVEHHPMGVGRDVLALLSVPRIQQADDIGPSLCPG